MRERAAENGVSVKAYAGLVNTGVPTRSQRH